MRRLMTAAAILGLVMLLGSVNLKPHSVMAGMQDVVTPVVHAQDDQKCSGDFCGGLGIPTCADMWVSMYQAESTGWGFVINGATDGGPIAYNVEQWYVGVTVFPPPGQGEPQYDSSIACTTDWSLNWWE